MTKVNRVSDIEKLLKIVDSEVHRFKIFLAAVVSVFSEDPELKKQPSVIHSIKSRIKDREHLREKLLRKTEDGPIMATNIFDRITDIAGVRILHLHQEQFPKIHACIQRQLDHGEWSLYEKPKAYTWDPESTGFFQRSGLDVQVKESFYTSIHYVVKPRPDAIVTCEIQVRTLFEEIWGEIDHSINYPYPTKNLACREQLRVLARLVGAGSRLADAIFRTFEEHARTEEEAAKLPRPALYP